MRCSNLTTKLCLLISPLLLLATHAYGQNMALSEDGSGSAGNDSDIFSGDIDPPSELIEGIDYLPFMDIFEQDGGVFGELGRTLDGCSRLAYVRGGLPLGSTTETEFRVCSNGIVSFGNNRFYWYYPQHFPTGNFRIRNSNVIAPFWNDHDHRSSISQVAYKIYDMQSDIGESALEKLSTVSNFVASQFVDLDFRGTWMVVVHWINVPPYPYGSYYYQRIFSSPPVNSYQAIVITDGSKTYTVYTYNCNMLEWVGNYQYSTIGYNINSKSARSINFPSFQNHRLSGLREIEMVACANAQQGINWSNLVYTIGVATDNSQLARAECIKRAAQDLIAFPQANDYDSPCPCSIWQAFFDSRYSYASGRLAFLTGDSSFYDNFCVVQRFPPRRSNIGVQLCCYSTRSNFGALLDSSYEYEASSLLRHHPFWNPEGYLQIDYPFRENCCFDGDICDVYTRLRPADTCDTYVAPRRAWCWGDPHITNLDGGVYTFNGWGEYTLLDIQTDDTSFVLQGRTHPVNGSTATQLVALAFGISQASAVEVRRSNNTIPLVVLFSGSDITSNVSNTNDTFETVEVTISRASSTSLVCSFPNGMGMVVNSTSMLGFTLIVPDEFRSITSGLSGNYNGIRTDDVVFRNGTMLPFNVSNRVLHEVGQSWHIEADDSLFTYPSGLTASDFSHPEHMPVFLDEVLANASEEVNQACGGNFDCIFDATQTGDLNIGLESMASNGVNMEEQEQAANTPPRILGSSVFYAVLGEETELTFNVTDDKNMFNVSMVDGLPVGSTLTPTQMDGYTDYTFRWTLQDIVNKSLVFMAKDELDALSVLNVQLQICACENGGNCTLDGLVSTTGSTIVLNCECPEAWEGPLCSSDVDGCELFMCFEGVDCIDTPAPGVGAMCGPCPDGYFGDGGKCADIDECANRTLHNCSDLCVNLDGSFECACSPGYRLLNSILCEDIDECSSLNGNCHQECRNSVGSFSCSCQEGYQLSSDDITCQVEPGAECDSGNNCTQSCVRVSGVEQCGCNRGYELADDSRTCTNVNECDQLPCDQECTDTDGAFECSCRNGFVLAVPNGILCNDINECVLAALDGQDICTPPMFCVNTVGSYTCQCPGGTQLVGDDCIVQEELTIIPPGIENNVVILTIEEYTVDTLTSNLEDMFKQLTAMAVNAYCEVNSCVFGNELRLTSVITENDVFIAEISNNDRRQITFKMYVQTDNGILMGTALIKAIQNYEGQFASAGFSISVEPLVPVRTPVSPLSTEQIIGIAVGGALAVLLLIAVMALLAFACYRCTKKTSKQTKVTPDEQELQKLSSKTDK